MIRNSEEDGDSGNEEVNNTEWFSLKNGVKWRKTELRQNIRSRCHNIVSRFPGTKSPEKDVTSPVKSWELFEVDNMKYGMINGRVHKYIFREMRTKLFTWKRYTKNGPSRNP
ncbi:hypothetical protein AVEN_149421-1 [Araneus ventricosus]|uniref:Uncharacterized protein n=1 Tax=Araneus ventricosus TaxID=182803 RepID=A0A4Y2P6C6_ARAVE|nr:hypothetical protein AVEN_149421-1 [Araneus ventricosus]